MIVQATDLADDIKASFITVKPGDDCFYCGDPLALPYVIWQGADGNESKDFTQIGLHPGCAERIGAALVHDGARAGEREQPEA